MAGAAGRRTAIATPATISAAATAVFGPKCSSRKMRPIVPATTGCTRMYTATTLDATRASAALGEKLADYWATSFIELLQDVAAFDLALLKSL